MEQGITSLPLEEKSRKVAQGVFINCPFDAGYQPFFEALVFTIISCGFEPRCSLENVSSNKNRFEKIIELIYECDIAIHDLSALGISDSGVPRFNMPFELGLFEGATRFAKDLNHKSYLIFEGEKYSFHKALSDLAGVDPVAHNGDVIILITAVRKFLMSTMPSNSLISLPYPNEIRINHSKFVDQVSTLTSDKYNWAAIRGNFTEMRAFMKVWISKINALSSNS